MGSVGSNPTLTAIFKYKSLIVKHLLDSQPNLFHCMSHKSLQIRWTTKSCCVMRLGIKAAEGTPPASCQGDGIGLILIGESQVASAGERRGSRMDSLHQKDVEG